MLKDARQGFRQFLDDPPGRRFTDLYARRRKVSGGRVNLLKVFHIAFGVALILTGIFFLAIPGPGITMTLIGCVLLGGESRIMAGLLDRAEILLRRVWPPLRAAWKRLPKPVRWLLILLFVGLVALVTWLSVLVFLALDPLRFFRATSP
jgi:amino acid permease